MKTIRSLSLSGVALLILATSYASIAEAGSPSAQCRHGNSAKCKLCLSEISSRAYLAHDRAEHWRSVRKLVTRLGELIREKEKTDPEIASTVKKLEKLLADEKARLQAEQKSKKDVQPKKDQPVKNEKK